MAGRSIEYLVGEDAPLVAHYGDKWLTMTENEKKRARIDFFLMALSPDKRNKLIFQAAKEAEYYDDESLYVEVLERELGVNGWTKPKRG